MDAIFQSTEQALHVSFLILSVPAMGENKFRQFLINVIDYSSDSNLSESERKKLREWLERLKGERSGSVDFSGLDQMEVRGQCAMVVSAVTDRLPVTESAALLARYGVGKEKQRGVVRLALHARRSCGIGLKPCGKLTARHFMTRRHKDSMSLRDLAEEFKTTKDRLQRAALWMAKHYAALEKLGISRLDPKFKAQGLVESEQIVADESAAMTIRGEPQLACD